MTEQLLEKIGAIGSVVEPFELAEAEGLPVGQVPGILQPGESHAVHQRLVLGSLLADLVVDGVYQLTQDMELVGYQHRARCTGLDEVDVGPLHVAADAFEDSGFLRAQNVEERFQRRFLAPLATPDQALALEVVDVGHVDVAALSRNLVDTDVGQPLQVAIRGPVGDRLINRRGHRPPGSTKQSRYLLPGQHPRPHRQRHHQRPCHALLVTDPRQRFRVHPFAPRAAHPPRLVTKLYRDPPHRHTGKPSHRARIPVRRPLQTLTALRVETQLRDDLRHQTRRPAPVTLSTRNPCNSTVALTRISTSMSPFSDA